MSETTLNVLIPAVASIAIAWLGLRLGQRRKNGNGNGTLLLPGQLVSALADSDRKIEKLRRGIRQLLDQIIGAGLDPVWLPDGDTGPLSKKGIDQP